MTTKTPRKAATKSSSTGTKATVADPTQVAKHTKKVALPPSPIVINEAVAAVSSSRPLRGKLGQIIILLEREEGASLIELMAETGWQAHSVRGAISTLKKKLGASLRITLNRDGLRQYRLEAQ